MSDLVQLSKEGDVAIITINNPPVNALSAGVPEGIEKALALDRERPEREGCGADRRRKDFYRRRGYQYVRADDLGQGRANQFVTDAAEDRRLLASR